MILCQKIIFFPILGGAHAGCAPPLDLPLNPPSSPPKIKKILHTSKILYCTRPVMYHSKTKELMLWVWIPLRGGVLDTIFCDKVCQLLAAGRWFYSDTSVPSINKTDHHNIAEILLKVALNTITLALFWMGLVMYNSKTINTVVFAEILMCCL